MSSLLGTRPRKRRRAGGPVSVGGSRAGRKRKHYVVVRGKSRKAFLMQYKAKQYQSEHGGMIVVEVR